MKSDIVESIKVVEKMLAATKDKEIRNRLVLRLQSFDQILARMNNV